MTNTRRLSIPLRLIILDAIGAVLLGIGVAELFAGTNIIPEAYRFANYEMIMIIFGIAFMLPMVTYILSGAKKTR